MRIAVGWPCSHCRALLHSSRYLQLRLTPEIAFAAASIEGELVEHGRRLAENDN